MSKIVVLFNLLEGMDHRAYENWARTTDLPVVNKLKAVNSFEVLKANALLGSEQPSPYQYIEIIDIEDMELFFEEVSSELMRKVAAEFQTFADNPMFIVSDTI